MASMHVHIIPMTMNHYEEVLALWRSCSGIGLSEADSPEHIEQYLQRNIDTSLVALHEGRIVGAVLAGHDGRRGYLYHLAVAPDFRKAGTGRALVHLVLEALTAVGITKCHAFVFHENQEGITFWKRIGWDHREDIGICSYKIQ
ncbi:MAG: GNAT family N-acetyltransferase [Thermodesulfobacteriota bacterium]